MDVQKVWWTTKKHVEEVATNGIANEGWINTNMECV